MGGEFVKVVQGGGWGEGALYIMPHMLPSNKKITIR